ncbi:hypothetical protein MP228_007940 [Amoeboaphelidium protococcarum]|nr:hypothetical protein MP228_007940 [Amoeboaphelidium protococcarum]
MTDQSIVKSVTMDEAVLQTGDGSDQQDQIDVEVDEVVSDESLISLLNQKTITLSSKVDTVELEKAKEPQYEYTGIQGDNFVMRYVGRVVRSLVSVAPEQQEEADELIDYARGRLVKHGQLMQLMAKLLSQVPLLEYKFKQNLNQAFMGAGAGIVNRYLDQDHDAISAAELDQVASVEIFAYQNDKLESRVTVPNL